MKKLRRNKTPESSGRRQRQTKSNDEKLLVTSTFAYRAKRADDTINLGRNANKTSVTAMKTTYSWLQRFGLIILLVAVVASVVNLLSLTSTVEVLPARTGETLPTSEKLEYQAAANKVLNGSILNRNKITVDADSISRALLKQFPDIGSVSVTIPLAAHRPIVYVEDAQPTAILIVSNGSFALDNSGKAIFEATSPAQLNDPNLPVIADPSNLSLKLNEQALPSNYMSFIETVVGQLNAKGFKASSLTLPAATNELDIGIAGQPYFVKFNLENNDPRQQAGTFLATIANLSSQHITPTKYVDVRIDGRAYYL